MNEAGPSGSELNMPTSASTSNLSIPIESTTFQSSFHALLLCQNTKNLNFTHLHPFAPSSERHESTAAGEGKGKEGRNDDGHEVERLRSLRESLSKIREVLGVQLVAGQGGDSAEVGRLIRGLREVTTHQAALLNSSTPLLGPSASSPVSVSSASTQNPTLTPLFASPLQLLPPITLLQNLSTSLGLQAFIEDSQFGLLKSSLAIAGNRVVVDVDLETDTPIGGEDEDMDDDTTTSLNATSTPLPSAALSSVPGKEAEKERGKVRLSKLVANHVTASGGTGKSEAITRILKDQIELYLKLWNGSPLPSTADATLPQGPGTDKSPVGDETLVKAIWEKEECLLGLKSILSELKEIDDLAEQGPGRQGTGDQDGNIDMFESVEWGIQLFDQLKSGQGRVRVYPAERDTIFPMFRLLPPSSSSSNETDRQATSSYNPTFRLRPAQINEEVSTPFTELDSASDQVGSGGNDESMEERWSEGNWVLELVDDGLQSVAGKSVGSGLVVRRNWLSGEDVESPGEGIRVENLLYQPFPSNGYLRPQPQPFPYTSTFVHTSLALPSSSEGNAAAQREQHWSIAQPGPQAFVLGKIGVPKGAKGMSKLIKALRRQVVLDSFFTGVFVANHLKAETLDIEENDDEDINDILDGPQKAIPITAIFNQNSMDISIPLLDSRGALNNVQLSLRCDEDAPDERYVRVDRISQVPVPALVPVEGGRDLIGLVEKVIASSSEWSG
ncbi:hypothetical protein IAT40_002316 [Kwoniella sp. CBS 6097]